MSIFALLIAASCGGPPPPSPSAAGPNAATPPNAASAPAAAPEASVPAAGSSEATNGGGGGADIRPRAALLTPLRGASSLGTAPRLIFDISCPNVDICPSDPPTTAALVAARIRLLDGNGAVTVVVPDPNGTPVPGPVVGAMTEYKQAFVAGQPLAPDSTYTIALTSDAQAVLGFIDESMDDATASLNTLQTAITQGVRVFSGSRPLPVELQATSAKPVTSVRVRFSEPVAVGSLVGNIAVVAAAGSALPSCPWAAAMNTCANASTAQITDLVDIAFATPVSLSDLQGGSLSLAGMIHGAGRTLGEAAAMLGRTLDPATGALTMPPTATMWFPCANDVACFRDVTAR